MNDRETPVNVLIGAVLLLIFATIVVASIGALGGVLYAIDLAAKRFVPSVLRSRCFQFYVFICLVSLVYGIKHLRQRRALNAFLSFAAIPMLAFAWLAGPHSRLGDNALFLGPWFLVTLIPQDSLVTRLEFALGCFAVAASVAVTSGLSGSGTLAQVATDSVIAAMFALIVISIRRQRLPGEGPQALPVYGA